jgi:hypothetical protein
MYFVFSVTRLSHSLVAYNINPFVLSPMFRLLGLDISFRLKLLWLQGSGCALELTLEA